MVSIIGNVMQALALVFALVSAVLLLAGVKLGARARTVPFARVTRSRT